MIVAVDWSGRRVGADRHIWLADDRGRLECGRDRDALASHLIELSESEPELIVGLDFAFSFPVWFLDELGVADGPELWDLAGKEGEGWLAECAPPFWGRPGRRCPPADGHRPMFRTTERELIDGLRLRPKSIFQIGGSGAVGTGSIRGFPVLARLHQAGFRVWPFTDRDGPVVLELWPRLFAPKLRKRNRDARAAFRPDLPPAAIESDDAFDAWVAATGLAPHAPFEFPEARSEVERREGRIWMPN